MTKASSNLQELRRRIYRKAKSETIHRFWGLFVHIMKIETLEEAYRIAKGNGGNDAHDGPRLPQATNLYLNEVDWFFDAVRRQTAEGSYEAVNYHRFADDSAPRAQRA